MILMTSLIMSSMISASGYIYTKNGFQEGSLTFSQDNYVLEERLNPSAEVKGWILPKTVNCHTHLGDAFIIPPKGCTLEELVAPPDGLKHRLLKSVGAEEQISCMRGKLSTIARTGTSHFIDFRESGLEGARRLLMASLGSGVSPVILGRPDSCDHDEVSAILTVADGIGMSSVSDVDLKNLSEISKHVSDANKIFGLHASEAKHEDFEDIISLKPDILVHMVMASDNDLKRCGEVNVPVAICPSSNAYFGLKPSLRKMLDAGVTVCVGTDNAMLAEPDILSEVRALREMYPVSSISDDEIMEIAFVNGRKVLNSLPGLGDENIAQPGFFVLEAPVDEPFMSVLKHGNGKIRMFDTGGIP